MSRKPSGEKKPMPQRVYEAYQQGAREFAEWLQEKSIDNTIALNYGKFKNMDIDELLAEWQKGKENELGN